MGYDVYELGDVLGISPSYISRMESGQRKLNKGAKVFTHDVVNWFAKLTTSSPA